MNSLERNKSHKLISIITPVYNTDKVILETVQSVFNQTLKEFEWLLINDGSKEALTDFLLNEIAKADSRVKVISHESNKGLPAARNTGVRNATAPFLFFLDADDLIESTFLEKAYLFLKANSEYAFVNSYVKGFGAQHYSWYGGFHDREVFLKENRNTSCFLARSQVFNEILFDEDYRDGCEDWEFWLHAASKDLWGYTIPEFLFFYRRSEGNKWATLKGRETLETIEKELAFKYATQLSVHFPTPSFTTFSFGEVAKSIEVPTSRITQSKLLLCIFPWLKIGGADQYNLNLLKGLKERGWEISIVTTLGTEHPWEEKFKEVTMDIFHLENLGAEYSYLAFLEYLIKSRGPEVIFLSNSMFGYYALPVLNQKFPDIPIVDYVHCEDIGWYKGGYPFFSSFYSNFLAKSFTTSENLKQWCIEKGGNAHKTEVCYINVDTDSIKPNASIRQQKRKELGLDAEVSVILYVARLTAQKQPQVLVNTLEKLRKNNLGFKCIIIGDGPERDNMLGAIYQQNLGEQVSYLGSLSNAEVLDYMDAADIFFLPSRYEGIALSIFEAMAKGLPVVGARVGGQAELVSEDCGYLINPSNLETESSEYASVLAKLIADPSLRKQLGANGRVSTCRSFNLTNMIDQVHHSFELLVNGKKIDDGTENQERAYEHLLNQMITLEKENTLLRLKLNSRIIRTLYKYREPYQRLKSVYIKLQRVIGK